MELSEKIRKLRKDKGLTQEQFAQQLFVSRTAVSKWETGRGIPSIESLQMIAKLYGITLDELLKADQIIAIADTENKANIDRVTSYIDGLFNVFAILAIILPLYKVETNGVFYSVPIYQFDGWLEGFYWCFPIAMAVLGIVQILNNKSESEKLKKYIKLSGMIINITAIFVLILNGQPYPAIMFFTLFIIKVSIMAVKKE